MACLTMRHLEGLFQALHVGVNIEQIHLHPGAYADLQKSLTEYASIELTTPSLATSQRIYVSNTRIVINLHVPMDHVAVVEAGYDMGDLVAEKWRAPPERLFRFDNDRIHIPPNWTGGDLSVTLNLRDDSLVTEPGGFLDIGEDPYRLWTG